MKFSKYSLLCMSGAAVVLIPYILGFSPNPADSASTTIGIAGGGGSYGVVSRDCSGRAIEVNNYPISDVGVSIDHKMSIFRFGAKAGLASVSSPWGDGTIRYVNPNAGLDSKFIGLQGGALFTNDFGGKFFFERGLFGSLISPGWYGYTGPAQYTTVYPSMSLRLGYLDKWYITTGLYDNLPLISGGGLLDFGIGFHTGLKPNSRWWVGFGIAPFDGAIASLKGDIPLSDDLLLNVKGNFKSGDATEYAFGVGTTILLH